MYNKIDKLCQGFESQQELISEERKKILNSIAKGIHMQIESRGCANLIYICTHNSRRSHFGQIWANVLAEYYRFTSHLSAFSGGTEVTFVHPHTIVALKTLGFKIDALSTGSNPVYDLKFGEDSITRCFSKLYDHDENPESGFLAIMTCSQADENCPFIPGADRRYSTPYDDPKLFDGTKFQNDKYVERAMDIGREIAYMFSVLSLKENNA